MRAVYKWGLENGINKARHSENCLCSTKSWAAKDENNHCDCELQWLRNQLRNAVNAIEVVLNDDEFLLGKNSIKLLNDVISNTEPDRWIK